MLLRDHERENSEGLRWWRRVVVVVVHGLDWSRQLSGVGDAMFQGAQLAHVEQGSIKV